MSQENVELAYRAADALNRRDLDAFLACIDPNVEFRPLDVELEGGGRIAATMASDAGSRMRSASSPTSAGRSRRSETWEM